MAYTIIKTNGTVLTTIQDGTINTTSTPLGLPGRNYAGYGASLDTNFVHQLENFANTAPPPNPLTGQLWYNTNNQTMYICPADGTSNANAWLALTSTQSVGATTFGSVTVTGNLQAGNITVTGTISAAAGSFTNLTVTGNANIANSTITTGNIGTLTTQAITTGGTTTAGTLTGTWTVSGGLTGNSLIVTGGNVYTAGIRTDHYYYANGAPFTPTGTYTNTNVYDYLTGSNSVTAFNGTVSPSAVITANITTGGSGTAGQITGNWSLTAGSRMIATYADLAERFAADVEYDAGTVVQLGGEKEVTAVQYELSEDVFGVVSDTAAYLMNGFAGDDITHPPIAVSGRVQVKVEGQVRKGQRLVSAGNGRARAAQTGEATAFNVIGRALTDKTTDDIGTVEAIVTIK